LGALSKKLQDYPKAVDYFCQAEDLYRTCVEHAESVNEKDPQKQSALSSSPSNCEVCLVQLIVETLQARAHLHYKYQQWIDEAIECHEEVVYVLEQQQLQQQERDGEDDIVYYKIHFISLTQEERWQLLITSLQALGKFYVERGEFEDGLMAYQEALRVLKQQQEGSTSPTQQRQEEISSIVKALSEIYLKTNDNDSKSIEISQMQRLALLQEDLLNWDKALSCWERVLYIESQHYGEESIEVAVTLCQLARVMVAQGNHEGALDLFLAATDKHTNSGLPRELIANVVHVFLQLRQHFDAIEWLQELLSKKGQTREEKSWIHCELGRVYLEQGHLVKASEALCLSAELCESDDEHVFKLLQKVHFLQKGKDLAGTNKALTSIVEDDDECIFDEHRKEARPTPRFIRFDEVFAGRLYRRSPRGEKNRRRRPSRLPQDS
jgi:tetratricopeptide (TPR) repeat protein